MITVAPSILFDQLDEFMLEFEQHDQMIEAGVMATGVSAAYAEVWEWGNVRQTQQGPRTVLGINPDGENVWLSSQAPRGYIHLNENQYWEMLKTELGKVSFDSPNAAGMTKELEAAALKAATKMAKLVSQTAPYDEGDLSKGIVAARPGDSILDESDTDRLLTLSGPVGE